MSKIDQWYTGKFTYSTMLNNHKPYPFPILTRLFKPHEMEHFDNMDHFNLITIILSNRIINADGYRANSEVKHVQEFYNKYFTPKKAESAMYLLNQYFKYPFIESFFGDFLSELRNLNHPYKVLLIYYMFELANADNEIENKELTELFKIATRIGVSKKELNQISAMYISGYVPYPDFPNYKSKILGQDHRKYGTNPRYRKKKSKKSSKRRTHSYSSYRLSLAYRVLGLNLNATIPQIKAAYRKLVKENHPDLFTYLGEQHVKNATAKIKEINMAYEYIQRIKRFS